MAARTDSDLSRATELDWLDAQRAEVASHYAGQVIAIAGTRVIAHGPDVATAMRLAREAGYQHPLVTAIPAQPVDKLHV